MTENAEKDYGRDYSISLLLMKAWCANNSPNYKTGIVNALYQKTNWHDGVKQWNERDASKLRPKHSIMSEFGHGNTDDWIDEKISEIEEWYNLYGEKNDTTEL